MNSNKVLDLTKDVKWIGVTDPDLITFDIVMETKFGTTYNSYFINAAKKTIVETVKLKFWDEYIQKLQKLTDPEDIKYIIVDHTEPDHTGSLAKLLLLAPDAVVVGSGNAIRYLTDILNFEFKSRVVKDGEMPVQIIAQGEFDAGDVAMGRVGVARSIVRHTADDHRA